MILEILKVDRHFVKFVDMSTEIYVRIGGGWSMPLNVKHSCLLVCQVTH